MYTETRQPETDCMERYHFACKIAKDKSVLDVACGSGYSTSLFIKAGIRSYDGVDINEKQIAYANYRYASHAYSVERVNYHIGDLCTFNNGKTFDMITCYGVIERIKDYESAIKNLYSLLN
ncbi:MAG: class I SAM-dependent methyltransferase, partial [Victivallaceae bacterium]|nr:class I SAM-dependent methyltransferase [Victivallaceae bacterium]